MTAMEAQVEVVLETAETQRPLLETVPRGDWDLLGARKRYEQALDELAHICRAASRRLACVRGAGSDDTIEDPEDYLWA